MEKHNGEGFFLRMQGVMVLNWRGRVKMGMEFLVLNA